VSAPLPRQTTQEMTRLYAVLACLLLIIAVQVVLLLVGVEGFARSETPILIAATLASGLSFAGAARLVRFISPTGGRDANR
jgi:hypothetical protein